jgi:hypothetical protein
MRISLSVSMLMMCLLAACDRPLREGTAAGWAVTRDAVAGEGDGPGALRW